MLWIIAAIIISYLIGSIPTAFIFGRLFKGIDIRKFGSGNVGATNAFRVLGKAIGVSVLAADIFKGFASVFFLGHLVNTKTTLTLDATFFYIILGLACVAGHNWTIFLRFNGGKGMAATLGVILALAIKISGLKIVLGLVLLVWVLAFLITRTVSIASVLSVIAFPILAIIFRQPNSLIFMSLLLSAVIIFRHKSNLKRIFEGEEPAVKFRSSQSGKN